MAYRRWDREEALLAQTLYEGNALTYDQIAQRLNDVFDRDRTGEKVRDGLRRGLVDRAIAGEADDVLQRTNKLRTETMQDGSTVIRANRPYSTDEMAEFFGVDTEQFTPGPIVTNTWSDFWQTKVKWLPNERNILAAGWERMLSEIREQGPLVVKVPPTRASGTCYEINLSDAHLGMLGWGPETGQDSDLALEAQRFLSAFESLFRRRPKGVERFLFPIGNDFFHFDQMVQGKGGATSLGTPQDVDTRYQKLFIVGCQVMEHCITKQAEEGPVDVLVVPGNHDSTTSFYMGEWLQARFANDRHVTIDNSPQPRKYYSFGSVGLGFTHGHLETKGALANLMQEEVPEMWANTKYREWHVGHKHFEALGPAAKVGTRIKVRQAPAMCMHDAWHREKGYLNDIGARGYVWRRATGLDSVIVHDMSVQTDPDEFIGATMR